ncbi:MAG: hypothetical protein SWH61_14100 [Thermodesulfobacteriota bacterium]|nr:hypothetical protein [Thermodesulfobacteriota bacterium]
MINYLKVISCCPATGLQQRLSHVIVWTSMVGIAFCSLMATNLYAGMDVMTDKQLQDVQGGEVLSIDISDPGYYGTNENVTVVRFSSDIYIENYGEFSELRLGNYERDAGELGPMLAADSSNILAYTQSRTNPQDGTGYFGKKVNLHADLSSGFYRNFGASNGAEYTQWDVNWEGLQMGYDEDHPVRLYGIVLRAEYSNFGQGDQELRRLIIGSNKLYGYGKVNRPLVTSAWLNSQLTNLPDDVVTTMGADDVDRIFQMQRDMFLDQYWQISSFHLNPANGSGFRQFVFNTNQNSVELDDSGFNFDGYGDFVDQNHGFFIMVDLTDEQFSGWNLIAGVNEYMGWPELESDDANKYTDTYGPPTMINPGTRPGY